MNAYNSTNFSFFERLLSGLATVLLILICEFSCDSFLLRSFLNYISNYLNSLLSYANTLGTSSVAIPPPILRTDVSSFLLSSLLSKVACSTTG